MNLSDLNMQTVGSAGPESKTISVFDCPHCVASEFDQPFRVVVDHSEHPRNGEGFSGIIDVPGHWRGVIEPSGIVGTIVPLEGHIVVRSSALFGGGHAVGE